MERRGRGSTEKAFRERGGGPRAYSDEEGDARGLPNLLYVQGGGKLRTAQVDGQRFV